MVYIDFFLRSFGRLNEEEMVRTSVTIIRNFDPEVSLHRKLLREYYLGETLRSIQSSSSSSDLGMASDVACR